MAGNPSPNSILISMHPRSLLILLLLLALLLPPDLLFAAADLDFLSPSLSPAPSPSPVPVPVPLPKNVASNRGGIQLPVPPPPPPPPRPGTSPSCYPNCHRGPWQRQHGVDEPPKLGKTELNFGEKMGLAFAGIAVAVQVVLGSFLVFKRMQLRKMENDGGLRRAGLPS